MRLYNDRRERLYINAVERRRFLEAALQLSLEQRAFCLTLLYTGCRISEARLLSPGALQAEARVLTLPTLKRRRLAMREVPIPPVLADTLSMLIARRSPLLADAPLWHIDCQPIPRITAYRWVKATMVAARIAGPQACPKGLRHGYAINGLHCGVDLGTISRWLGHASISTTLIYTETVGPEQLALGDRMWQETPPSEGSNGGAGQ